MYEGFLNDFPGGLAIEQFTNLFPDLNNGMATANLVFRVLDDDNSEKLGFKEFLQAIDLVGARFVHIVKLSSMSIPCPYSPDKVIPFIPIQIQTTKTWDCS